MKKTIFALFTLIIFSSALAQKPRFDQCLLSVGVAGGLSTYTHWRDPHRPDEFLGKINPFVVNPSVTWRVQPTKWAQLVFGPSAEIYCSSQAPAAIGVIAGITPVFKKDADFQLITITGGCYKSFFSNDGSKAANKAVNTVVFSAQMQITLNRHLAFSVGAFTHEVNGRKEILPQATIALRISKGD